MEPSHEYKGDKNSFDAYELVHERHHNNTDDGDPVVCKTDGTADHGTGWFKRQCSGISSPVTPAADLQ